MRARTALGDNCEESEARACKQQRQRVFAWVAWSHLVKVDMRCSIRADDNAIRQSHCRIQRTSSQSSKRGVALVHHWHLQAGRQTVLEKGRFDATPQSALP